MPFPDEHKHHPVRQPGFDDQPRDQKSADKEEDELKFIHAVLIFPQKTAVEVANKFNINDRL